ncbi:MAG: dTMP kinase [Hydrogenophilus sp.]|nr:dTMP kinase [Hydrogenophilus sp.]
MRREIVPNYSEENGEGGQRRGRLVVFEGIDGAGKSTQVEALADWLQQQGKEVVRTREPGGTEVGERLRELVLRVNMRGETELLLMCAARCEHVRQVIAPALARGAWVVCDRFADATFAYQVRGRGVEEAWFAVVDELARGGVTPDLVFVFDLPPKMAAERRGGKRGDRFEGEEQAFFARVRAGYQERAAADPGRYVVLDARAGVDQLSAAVVAEVQQRGWL